MEKALHLEFYLTWKFFDKSMKLGWSEDLGPLKGWLTLGINVHVIISIQNILTMNRRYVRIRI